MYISKNMTTNKGNCTKCEKVGAPFQVSGNDGKFLQEWRVEFSDGGAGACFAPSSDQPPFAIGQEYSYVGTFSKTGKVKIQVVTTSIDRDHAWVKAESLKLANTMLMQMPQNKEGITAMKDHMVQVKLTAKSLEKHILQTTSDQ